MTFQPWIHYGDPELIDDVTELQWSHDLSAMDTVESPTGTDTRFTLQWSHDLSAMDTVSLLAMSATTETVLQWSHDLSAMDTSSPFRSTERRTSRFNGAMTFQPWIRQSLD